MFLSVYVCIYKYIRVYECICVHMYACVIVCGYVYMSEHVWMCMLVCMFKCGGACVCPCMWRLEDNFVSSEVLSPLFVRKRVSLAWDLPSRAGWRVPGDLPVLGSPMLGLQVCCHHVQLCKHFQLWALKLELRLAFLHGNNPRNWARPPAPEVEFSQGWLTTNWAPPHPLR